MSTNKTKRVCSGPLNWRPFVCEADTLPETLMCYENAMEVLNESVDSIRWDSWQFTRYLWCGTLLQSSLTIDSFRPFSNAPDLNHDQTSGIKSLNRGLILTCLWSRRQIDQVRFLHASYKSSKSSRDTAFLWSQNPSCPSVVRFRYFHVTSVLISRLTSASESQRIIKRQ